MNVAALRAGNGTTRNGRPAVRKSTCGLTRGTQMEHRGRQQPTGRAVGCEVQGLCVLSACTSRVLTCGTHFERQQRQSVVGGKLEVLRLCAGEHRQGNARFAHSVLDVCCTGLHGYVKRRDVAAGVCMGQPHVQLAAPTPEPGPPLTDGRGERGYGSRQHAWESVRVWI